MQPVVQPAVKPVEQQVVCWLDVGCIRDGTGSRVTGSQGHRVSDFDQVGSGHGSVCQIGV